jgi:hypothetical protein
MGCYYELDRFGECRFFAKTWRMKAWEIAELFPELYDQIIPPHYMTGKRNPDADLEVARVADGRTGPFYFLRCLTAQHAHRRPLAVRARPLAPPCGHRGAARYR